MVDLVTAVLLDVPRPTFSVEVVLGLLRTVDALTNLPVRALLLTVRAMAHTSFLPTRGMDAALPPRRVLDWSPTVQVETKPRYRGPQPCAGVWCYHGFYARQTTGL